MAGTTSSALERLFQRASHTSRGVKNHTALGGAGRSLVRLALEMTSSRIADLSAARVLVVGTGQYAGTTVAALRDRGVEQIAVFSPSGKGAKFALKNGLRLEESLPVAVAGVDVVITCTSALAVHPADFSGEGRRIVIDLGLPRNVDPAVAGVAGVELLDLETIRVHAPLEELSATDDARTLVGTAAAEFAAESVIEPAIVALRTHIFGLLDAEIARNPESERALRHLAGVLLHGPSVRARELAVEGRSAEVVDALDALYGIRPALGNAASVDDLTA
jgi:glutamyl-tRNA reductase